ncbi:hypothetical protein JTE90_000319 [Oedothorax gibbosus]|uniref:Uncharacterized protein n=1 Tax=Oedothorax gibbosus TaxID=931172 RepID=A0AAV6VRF8_9ARAC|nr:hypothetical protein JTE90_000319 [Oedothorax gibbosus]
MLNNQPSVINIENDIKSKRFGKNSTEDGKIMQNIENKKRDEILLYSLQEYPRSLAWTGRIEELDNKHGIPRVKRTQRIQLRSLDDAKDKDVNKKDDEDEENDDPLERNKYIYIPVRAHWKIRSRKKIAKPQKPVQEMEAPSKNCETEPKPEEDYQQIDPGPFAASSQWKNSPPCIPCMPPCPP